VRAWPVLAIVLAGCAPDAPVAGFELRSVVAPALARLEHELGPTTPVPGETGHDLEEILGPLRSGDADLRALAIEDARALSRAGVAALGPVLLDTEETVECRTAVAEVLGSHATPEALDALCVGLETGSEPWLRAQCAYRLGRAGDDVVLPRLLLRLKYEEDFETVFWVADACTRFGNLSGLEAMFVVWNASKGEGLRERIAQRTFEVAGERGAGDAQQLLARWQTGELRPAPDGAPSPRLELETWRRIRDLGDWNLRTVDDARFVLSHLEAWVVPSLAAALHEDQVYVRLHAAQCLERMGPRAAGALDDLMAALDEPRIAPAAAAALGALGRPRAAAALEQRLDASPDIELRVAAASALGRLASPSSLDALRRAFDAARPFDLRQAAAASLARIAPDRAALEFLIGALADPRADAGAAELALGEWLARRAELEPAIVPAFERWRALDAPAGSIPTDEELARRRAERSVVLRPLVP
jgi:HEAT repeat protein